MEDRNEFSDLILDDQAGGNKTKKLLLNTVVIIIVVLIAMVGYRLMSIDDSQTQQESTNAAFTPATNNFDSASENLIVKQNETFDDFKANLTENDTQNSFASSPVAEQEPTFIPPIKTDTPKEEVKPKKPVVQDAKPVNNSKNTSLAKQDPFEKINVAASKPKAQVVSNSGKAVPGAYIQVLAGTKLDLNSSEVKNIKAKGFDFVVYKDEEKGVEKLLIGPFSGDTLTEKRDEIRQKVKKDAFIFRVK